mmetsp:Transcript_71224/g.118371  ORF Transcript_71224/g.118371 Transcript_71224/m.118371 type:complete len:91 (-) Transcript_71224:592-864(-)
MDNMAPTVFSQHQNKPIAATQTPALTLHCSCCTTVSEVLAGRQLTLQHELCSAGLSEEQNPQIEQAQRGRVDQRRHCAPRTVKQPDSHCT